MRPIPLLLVLIGLGTFSNCGQPDPLQVRVTVVDRPSAQPIDSAGVVLFRIFQDQDTLVLDTQWTAATGTVTLTWQPETGFAYEAMAFRRHYREVLHPSGGYYEHWAPVPPEDTSAVVLYLEPIPPPDPERYERMHAEVPLSEVLLTLKTDQWAWTFLPRLGWDDIPGLLEAGRDTGHVAAYPRHPLSTYRPDSARVGLVALWLIEAIRRREAAGSEAGNLMPPSRAPVLGTRRGNPSGYNTPAQVRQAQAAYQTWWDGLQSLEDPRSGARRNPLSGSGYSWM
ncbi:MAG: DUF4943 domain-containing protein [Bacteroidetes bacterium]|nr:MAG: DUF4943 domain-containing protein [Bacteroidota bacterium]